MERLTHLVPTALEQWAALFVLENDEDVHSHIQCRECGAGAYIVYYVQHQPGCLAAAFLVQAIENLPRHLKQARRMMEKHL